MTWKIPWKIPEKIHITELDTLDFLREIRAYRKALREAAHFIDCGTLDLRSKQINGNTDKQAIAHIKRVLRTGGWIKNV